MKTSCRKASFLLVLGKKIKMRVISVETDLVERLRNVDVTLINYI